MAKEHDDIWGVIDRIALMNSMSVSALAKKAGLDATAFNRSKRAYPSGKCRWPSTASLVKVLKASSLSWRDFTRILECVEGSCVDVDFPSFGR